MNQRPQTHVGVIVAAIIVGLIVAGGFTLWVTYPTTDRISFYIVAAAIVLAPIFVLAAYFVNRKMKTVIECCWSKI